MITAIAIGVLVIAGLAYVIAPIGRMKGPIGEIDETSEAADKKRLALAGILDLEEERDAGKLSDEEFREIRARYEYDALAALKELDGLDLDTDDRLEREIADARAKLRCSNCGAARGPGATRCPSCGSPH